MQNSSFHERCSRDHGFHDRNRTGQNYWDDYARTIELTSEGNRLIARDIENSIRRVWQVTTRWLGAAADRQDHNPNLPPS